MAGLVPEDHRILVYGQELEKEVDLDTNSENAFCLYFLLVCEPRFAELGLGSATIEGLTRLALVHSKNGCVDSTHGCVSIDCPKK